MLSKKVGPCSNQHVPMWQTPNNVTCTRLMTTTMIPFLLVSALLTVMASQEQGILGIRGGSYWAVHIVEYDVIQCITYFKFSMPPQKDRAMAVSTGAVPAIKPEATAIFAPQDGRWKITVSFDGRRFCVPKFRH